MGMTVKAYKEKEYDTGGGDMLKKRHVRRFVRPIANPGGFSRVSLGYDKSPFPGRCGNLALCRIAPAGAGVELSVPWGAFLNTRSRPEALIWWQYNFIGAKARVDFAFVEQGQLPRLCRLESRRLF